MNHSCSLEADQKEVVDELVKPLSSNVTPQNIRGISAAAAVLQPLKQVRHMEEKYLTPGLESALASQSVLKLYRYIQNKHKEEKKKTNIKEEEEALGRFS